MIFQAINDTSANLTSSIVEMWMSIVHFMLPFLWLPIMIWFMYFLLVRYGFLVGKTDEEVEEEQRRGEIYDGCVDIMEEQRWENMSVGEWRRLQYEAGIEEKEKLKNIQSSASIGATLGVINLFH